MNDTIKKFNICILGWNDFDPDLIKNMWDLVKSSTSISVKSEGLIVLEFNAIGPDWKVTKKEELKDWSDLMLEKFPKYLLVPFRLKEGKIACYISKVESIMVRDISYSRGVRDIKDLMTSNI